LSVETNRLETLNTVLDGLMRRYRERVADVEGVIQAMIRAGLIANAGEIENDHIAFRTMGVPKLGVSSLEKIFLHLGYVKRDRYEFKTKKLNAWWYAPPAPQFPRVFISELRVGELSDESGRIIRSYTDEVTSDPVDAIDLDDGLAIDRFLHRPLWRTPVLADYLRLEQESEYAAWVIYNRYYLNHFTVSVHHLPDGFNTIDQFNVFLEANGFQLNDSGGKAKKSGDGLLIQSSTVAQIVDAVFDDGSGGEVLHQIAGSYVEFAERREMPQPDASSPADPGRKNRRDGFEATNADKIFESTWSDQTKRKQKPES